MDREAGSANWRMAANTLAKQLRATELVIQPLLQNVKRLGLGTIECGHLSAKSGFELALKLGQHAEDMLLMVLERGVPIEANAPELPSAGQVQPASEFAFDSIGQDHVSFALELFESVTEPELVEWNRLLTRLELEAESLDSMVSQEEATNRGETAMGDVQPVDNGEAPAKPDEIAERGEVTNGEDAEADRYELDGTNVNGRRQKSAVDQIATTKVTWQAAADKMLGMLHRNEPFTSQRKLGKQIGCSASTINTAIKETEVLHEWAQIRTVSTPKAQSLTEVVIDNVAQSREADPADFMSKEDVDEILERLVWESQADGRDELRKQLSEKTPDERRKLASIVADDPDVGDKILGRKP
jgi:hypothetical protein